jgi:hypothetical protein
MKSIRIPAPGAALVELYTSEGRPDHPPAGREPGDLRGSLGVGTARYRCASADRSL